MVKKNRFRQMRLEHKSEVCRTSHLGNGLSKSSAELRIGNTPQKRVNLRHGDFGSSQSTTLWGNPEPKTYSEPGPTGSGSVDGSFPPGGLSFMTDTC